MKLIIAGTRTLVVSVGTIQCLIDEFEIKPSEIVSGMANGIDKCGEKFGIAQGITIKRFPAQWKLHGKPAGHIRNKEMAQYADCLLLIWDGESPGSMNMKFQMTKLKKPICEVILKVS